MNNNDNNLNIGIANIMIKSERPLPKRIGHKPFDTSSKIVREFAKKQIPGEAGVPN